MPYDPEQTIYGDGKLNQIYEAIVDLRKEILDWQAKHDGQGEGTTHKGIELRLASVEKSIVRTQTLFGVISGALVLTKDEIWRWFRGGE